MSRAKNEKEDKSFPVRTLFEKPTGGKDLDLVIKSSQIWDDEKFNESNGV